MQDFYSMIGFAPEAHVPAPMEAMDEPDPQSAIFLDFDGTLVDIAPAPDLIEVPSDLVAILERLRRRHGGALAIVSGRDISDIDRRLPGFRGALAGGHGSQLRLPERPVERVGVDEARVSALQSAARAFAATEAELLVEDKDAGVVVHYRSRPELEEKVRAFAHALADSDPDFTCQPAKMAMEIRPAGVNKGRAIARLLASEPFAGRTPWFFGDDRTDEAGFEEVNGRGGVSVKIGEGQTCARYQIASAGQFREWLSRLAGEGR